MFGEQNLNRYWIFYAAASAGSISKASERLYISQPAVSKAIKKLEESLNTTLFRRTRKGVTLTTDGKLLYEQLSLAFSSIQSAEEQLRANREPGAGKLTIGASATLSRYLLIPYLRQYIAQNPHTKITIECQDTAHTQKLLEDGRIDIAIVQQPQNAGLGAFAFLPMWELEDIFVASPAYLENLELREGNSAGILSHANFMLMDEENITRQYVDSYLRRNNLEVKNILDVTTMELLIEFARIGMGVACVIREFVAEDLAAGRLVEIPLKTPIHKRTVGFAAAKEDLRVPSVKQFFHLVEKSSEDGKFTQKP